MSFIKAAALADVPEGGSLAIELGGKDLALVRHGDTVFAIEDWCSHGEVPLSDGDVEITETSCEIECFLHGSRFDLRTGAALCLPATEPVPVYPVKIDGNDVLVDLESPLTPPPSLES